MDYFPAGIWLRLWLRPVLMVCWPTSTSVPQPSALLPLPSSYSAWLWDPCSLPPWGGIRSLTGVPWCQYNLHPLHDRQRVEQEHRAIHGLSLHLRLCRRHASGDGWRHYCRCYSPGEKGLRHRIVQFRAVGRTSKLTFPPCISMLKADLYSGTRPCYRRLPCS